tara:strand:+ start:967 stop:1191 length:225 start_codon:yes stop_codon:yes gene_type:complete
MSEEQVQNVNQAVGLLVQAANLAQKRGAFNLEEAAILSQAVNFLTSASQQNLELPADLETEESAESEVTSETEE